MDFDWTNPTFFYYRSVLGLCHISANSISLMSVSQEPALLVLPIHSMPLFSLIFCRVFTYVCWHARKDIDHDYIYTGASFGVYNTVELIDAIVQLCDWLTLVAVGNTCIRERNVVNCIIRKHVATCLARFVFPDSVNRFLELVDISSTALVGGFVRHIMCLNESVYDEVYPRSMDILVPIGGGRDRTAARKLANFLSNAGLCSQTMEIESLQSLQLVSQFTFVCSNEVPFCYSLWVKLIH